ncbi:MAG: hypothetical protein ACJAYU_000192 [Bradymonadia bacterium]|jgi:hypothetical protein
MFLDDAHSTNTLQQDIEATVGKALVSSYTSNPSMLVHGRGIRSVCWACLVWLYDGDQPVSRERIFHHPAIPRLENVQRAYEMRKHERPGERENWKLSQARAAFRHLLRLGDE